MDSVRFRAGALKAGPGPGPSKADSGGGRMGASKEAPLMPAPSGSGPATKLSHHDVQQQSGRCNVCAGFWWTETWTLGRSKTLGNSACR